MVADDDWVDRAYFRTPKTGSRSVWRFGMLATGCVVVVIASLRARSGVGNTEAEIFKRVNRLPESISVPTYLLMQAGNLGAVGAWALVAHLRGDRRLAFRFGLAGLSAWLLGKMTKALVDRDRPGRELDVRVRGREQSGKGFPSGHVAVSTTMAVIATGSLPALLAGAAWSLVCAAAFGRLYVGAHLPLDVVGGFGLGLAVGAAADSVSLGRSSPE